VYGYVYLTTNLINGKQYVGRHKSKNFNEKYKGSGSLVVQAIKKYGADNFSVKILEMCSTEEDLADAEYYYTNLYHAYSNENFYNIIPGGQKIGGIHNPMYGRSGKNAPAYGRTGNKHPLYGITGKNNHNYGKVRTEDTKRKISDKRKNTVAITDGKITMYIKNTDALPQGYIYGIDNNALKNRKQTNDRKSKQSNTIKGRKVINNGLVEKHVCKADLDFYLSNGYKLGPIKHRCNENAPMYGKKQTEYMKKFTSENTKNRVWMHKEKTCKRVLPNDIEKYLKSGFVIGRS